MYLIVLYQAKGEYRKWSTVYNITVKILKFGHLKNCWNYSKNLNSVVLPQSDASKGCTRDGAVWSGSAVCPDLSVRKLRIITVIHFCLMKCLHCWVVTTPDFRSWGLGSNTTKASFFPNQTQRIIRLIKQTCTSMKTCGVLFTAKLPAVPLQSAAIVLNFENMWFYYQGRCPKGAGIMANSVDYKNLQWLWDANWKFHHECAKVIQSDGIFNSHLKHYGIFFLHTVPSTITFRLQYVLSNLCWNNYIFRSRDVRFLRRWRLKVWWKTDINMTSKLASPRHARTPCKTKFPSPGWIHGNSGRVCKKLSWSGSILFAQTCPSDSLNTVLPTFDIKSLAPSDI